MTQWKIVSQKPVFKSELFKIDEIRLENSVGEEKVHNLVTRDTIVTIFPLTSKYEIYLGNQYRYSLGKTIIEAIAGHVDRKESTISAARRELKEESGIEAEQIEEFARVETSGSVFKSRVHLFLAKGLEMGKSNPEDDEEIDLVKMPLTVAVEKVMSGEIYHSTTMLGILMLDRLKKEKKL